MVLPLDMPDDYIWQPGSGKSQLADLGELAVRLGSIVTYDRRGSVYWLDGFEDGLSCWQVVELGTGAEVRYQTQYVNTGLIAAKLTAGSDGTPQAFVKKRLSPALLTTYGLEVTFSLGGNNQYFFLLFNYYTGVTNYGFTVLINVVSGSLNIIDNDAGIVSVYDIDITDNYPQLFHTCKLVVDMINLKYVRLLYDQVEVDISDYTADTNASADPARIEIQAGCQSTTGDNGISYVDNVIVTVGDP